MSRGHYLAEDQSRERHYFTEEGTGYIGQQLELECQSILRSHGYMCILEADGTKDSQGQVLTSLDTLTNFGRADIRSITVNGIHTVRNAVMAKNLQLVKFNRQNHSRNDTLLLHYHQPLFWDLNKIKDAFFIVPILVKTFHVRRIICTIRLPDPTDAAQIEREVEKIRLKEFIWEKVIGSTMEQTPSQTKSDLRIESHFINSKRNCSAVVTVRMMT